MFSALLQVCNEALQNTSALSFDIQGRDGPVAPITKIDKKVRRLLPWVRQLSGWFTSRAALLANDTLDESLNHFLDKLRQHYRKLIANLGQYFPLATLPQLDYLLEEDEVTIGFAPLIKFEESKRLKRRYCTATNGTLKPRAHDHGVLRLSSSGEMLGRIKDILEDGSSMQLQHVSLSNISGHQTLD